MVELLVVWWWRLCWRRVGGGGVVKPQTRQSDAKTLALRKFPHATDGHTYLVGN